MSDPKPTAQTRLLASEVRLRFVKEIGNALPLLVKVVKKAFSGIDSKELQQLVRKNSSLAQLDGSEITWVKGVQTSWGAALIALNEEDTASSGQFLRPLSTATTLSLVGDEEVESQILSSRLVLAISDKSSREFSDLRIRMRQLEGAHEMSAKDVLRAEILANIVVDQWFEANLSRDIWNKVHEQVQETLAQIMTEAYHHANEFLIEKGIQRQIDLRPLMRRAADVGVGTSGGGSAGGNSAANFGAAGQGQGHAPSSGVAQGGHFSAGSGNSRLSPGGYAGLAPQAPTVMAGAVAPQATGFVQVGGAHAVGTEVSGGGVAVVGDVGAAGYAAADGVQLITPMVRVRQRAQGVLVQLRRILSDRIDDFDSGVPVVPSADLAAALKVGDDGFPVTILMKREPGAPVDVDMVARHVDQHADGLKKKSTTESEKAIVEVVALMFQAILAEDRIPAVVRVWFARLQIPVLRVAMVDPDFFKNMDHPARQLIDRMGSCVLGFDAANLEGGRLEAEIRRVVQVIEQYPETGKRVFQLVFDEFKKFLSRHLTGNETAKRLVSLAQQVEQKEALSIQYTIELRKMLGTLPVSDDIREFMFKVWADVMAVAAVRHGGQHIETLAMKRTATDLVWAASPKQNSRDRTAVIQGLPGLLLRLRKGMDMLNLSAEVQEARIKTVNDAVAQAFLNRANTVSNEQLEQLARSLASLEDVVTDDAAGDVMLDPSSIELMLGVDASALEVITQGGAEPSAEMLAWARELEIAQWFTLNYQGEQLQVQYAWRSDRGQIHLFSTAAGNSYLIQARRLASYLQAGLITPSEEEALTVRATRMAIARLEAEPTRLQQ